MIYIYLDKPKYDPETEMLMPDYKIEYGTFISGWKVEKIPDEDGYVSTPEEQPDGVPTLRARVELLESNSAEMLEALDMLLSGVTE